MTLPTLYSFRRCPYAIRTRMLLLLVEQPVVVREITLRDKPKALLQLSGKATVPVMQLPDGTVLDESLDIMYWAIERVGDARGLCDRNRQLQDELIGRNDTEFKHWLDRYKYHTRFPEQSKQYYRDQALKFVKHLDELLTDTDALTGDQVSLADIAILPFIRQFSMVDPQWFEASACLSVKRWLDNWLAHPVFVHAMQKYEIWFEGRERQDILQMVDCSDVTDESDPALRVIRQVK